jgi:hypothetical protein
VIHREPSFLGGFRCGATDCATISLRGLNICCRVVRDMSGAIVSWGHDKIGATLYAKLDET